MKPTLVVIGTCYSGISLLASQMCLIAQHPINKQLWIISTGMHHATPVDLHELYGAYSSITLNLRDHEVKTHD